MAITPTNEAKSNVTVTNATKVGGGSGVGLSWAGTAGAWEDQGKSTWELQRTTATNETKNAVSVSNEAKT